MVSQIVSEGSSFLKQVGKQISNVIVSLSSKYSITLGFCKISVKISTEYERKHLPSLYRFIIFFFYILLAEDIMRTSTSTFQVHSILTKAQSKHNIFRKTNQLPYNKNEKVSNYNYSNCVTRKFFLLSTIFSFSSKSVRPQFSFCYCRATVSLTKAIHVEFLPFWAKP